MRIVEFAIPDHDGEFAGNTALAYQKHEYDTICTWVMRAIVEERAAAQVEITKLKGIIDGLTERIAAQSALLSKRAEKPT